MKKIIICAAIIFSTAAINEPCAQVRVNVNLNIGSQPDWGPVGYDHVDYYYLPDIETYYYVPSRQFIYLSGSNWIFSTALPPTYRTYNLYRGYKVVVNEPRAYQYYQSHKVKYARYKGNGGQFIIKNSKAAKYKRNGHDNGNHNGQNNGRGRGRH
jgi:hypothetical protein